MLYLKPGACEVKKGEEKGYFEYGGSTIVMFFPPNIMIDEDILRQSQAGYETQVFIGDKIGQRKE